MRIPQLISDFFEWRWAPSVSLTAGSLAFVALALLLIPTELGSGPSVVAGSTLTPMAATQPTVPRKRALFSSAIADGVSGRVPSPRAVDAAAEQSAPIQRGFSPVADRPALPAQAVETPTPPPAPTPEPGSIVVQQPEPGGPSREFVAQ